MNKQNPFQQLVDQSLSELQWNDGMKRKTLHAIDEERSPYMKKKLSAIVAFALVLCLMTGVALAATLVYSDRYHQAARADALLLEKYGITENMLAFFTRTSQEDVYSYDSSHSFSGMPGRYQVNVATNEVYWFFDGPEGYGWDAKKLDEVITACQQPDGYHQVAMEAKAAAEKFGMTAAPLTMPSEAELAAILADSAARSDNAKAVATISMTEAEALARNAIQQKYQLTDEQMKKLEFVEESSLFNTTDDGTPVVCPYFFLTQSDGVYTEKDGIYIVDINVLDGAIEDILYDNALLGNG